MPEKVKLFRCHGQTRYLSLVETNIESGKAKQRGGTEGGALQLPFSESCAWQHNLKVKINKL